MLRFSTNGELEACIKDHWYLAVNEEIGLKLDNFPVPIQIQPKPDTVVISLEYHGIKVVSTYLIDRARCTVSPESGCPAASLAEWSRHFFEFIGYAS